MKKTIIILSAILLPAFMLLGLSAVQNSQQSSGAGEAFEKALYVEEVGGDLKKAIDLYREILKNFPANREVAAKAQLHIGLCLEKKGLEEARKAYQTVVDNYPDQIEIVRLAREKLQGWPIEINPSGQDKGQFSQRRILVENETQSWGRISPDGKYYAYINEKSEGLFLRNLHDGDIRKVVSAENKSQLNTRIVPSCLPWSSDGNFLAYLMVPLSGPTELHIYNISDHSSRILPANKKEELRDIYNWTDDGKKILASVREDHDSHWPTLGWIDTQNGVFTALLQPGKPDLFSSLVDAKSSPDGCCIAIVLEKLIRKGTESFFENPVVLLQVDNGVLSPLLEIREDDYFLDWAPDGKKILFISNRTGKMDLWGISIEKGKPSSQPELIKEGVGPIRSLGMTGSGSLFYKLTQSSAGIATALIDMKKIRITGQHQFISRRFETPWLGAISPDSNYFAYIAVPGPWEHGRSFALMETSYICVYSFQNHSYKEFPLGPQISFFPRWENDNRHILLIKASAKNRRLEDISLQRIDTANGEIETLFRNKGTFDYADVSSDGKFLYFISGKKKTLTKTDVQSGQSVELYSFEDYQTPELFTVSPDNRWIACIVRDDVLLFPAEGGQPKILAMGPKSQKEIDSLCFWMPDGKTLLVTKLMLSERQDPISSYPYIELWLMPVDGGHSVKIETNKSWEAVPFAFPVATDGKRILFATNRYHREIWVMENFLTKDDPHK